MARAARDELVERGYAGATMTGIARRAGSSKETLYRWYSDKTGLMRALVIREGDAAHSAVEEALTDTDTAVEDVLVRFAARLLVVLTSPWSVTANRAAMSAPELAEAVLVNGRHRIGPLVERYLAEQHRRGRLHAPDPASAFTELYGLVVRDTQILALLGTPLPSDERLVDQARSGVTAFLRLHRPRRSGAPGG